MREYRLVDDVYNDAFLVTILVEAQTLRFGGGLYVRRLWEIAGGAIVTVDPPGAGIFLSSHNKIHDTRKEASRGIFDQIIMKSTTHTRYSLDRFLWVYAICKKIRTFAILKICNQVPVHGTLFRVWRFLVHIPWCMLHETMTVRKWKRERLEYRCTLRSIKSCEGSVEGKTVAQTERREDRHTIDEVQEFIER